MGFHMIFTLLTSHIMLNQRDILNFEILETFRMGGSEVFPYKVGGRFSRVRFTETSRCIGRIPQWTR